MSDRQPLLEITSVYPFCTDLSVHREGDEVCIHAGTGCEDGLFIYSVEDFMSLSEAFYFAGKAVREYIEETNA